MGTIIINCKKVYDTGELYQKKLDELKEIQKRLGAISNTINENWEGKDSNNYIASLNSHINDLNDIIEFLEENSSILKDDALGHSKVDSNFVTQLERSDINEYRKNQY